MNYLTLCGKVIDNQMSYTDNNDPVARLTLKYKWNDDGKEQRATIEAEYYGDRAIDIHTECNDCFLIVQGRFERYQLENSSDYRTVLIGNGLPEIIDSFISVNKIALCGRLGKRPKRICFNDGATRASFTLAVNRYSGDPNWYNVEAWGQKADVVDRYADKGSLIGVEGQLRWYLPRDKETGAYLKNGAMIPFIRTENLTLLGNSNKQSKQYEEDF